MDHDRRARAQIEADAFAGKFDAFILPLATMLDSGDPAAHVVEVSGVQVLAETVFGGESVQDQRLLAAERRDQPGRQQRLDLRHRAIGLRRPAVHPQLDQPAGRRTTHRPPPATGNLTTSASYTSPWKTSQPSTTRSTPQRPTTPSTSVGNLTQHRRTVDRADLVVRTTSRSAQVNFFDDNGGVRLPNRPQRPHGTGAVRVMLRRRRDAEGVEGTGNPRGADPGQALGEDPPYVWGGLPGRVQAQQSSSPAGMLRVRMRAGVSEQVAVGWPSAEVPAQEAGTPGSRNRRTAIGSGPSSAAGIE
jgi:hypothetical protein